MWRDFLLVRVWKDNHKVILPVFYNNKYLFIIKPRKSIPRCLPKRNKNVSLQRLVHKYSHQLHPSGRKLETTQASIGRWADGQIMEPRSVNSCIIIKNGDLTIQAAVWMSRKNALTTGSQNRRLHMHDSIYKKPHAGKTHSLWQGDQWSSSWGVWGRAAMGEQGGKGDRDHLGMTELFHTFVQPQ